MSASNLSPVQLFSKCLKFYGAKLNRMNALCSRSVVDLACPLERAGSTFGPLARHNLWLCQPDYLVWSRSVSYTTAVSRSQSVSHTMAVSRSLSMSHTASVSVNEKASDSATNESAEVLSKGLSRPLRRDRLEQQSLLHDIILSRGEEPWTDNDWQQVGDRLCMTGGEPWEVMCMHTLYMDKNISLARSLMAYLERHRNEVSLIAVIFYIGLLGESCAGLDAQQEEMYRYYQHLLSRTSVLDAASIEVLISGLSSTRYYLECLKLVETCRETSAVTITIMINLLRAALRYNDMDICQLALSEIEQLANSNGITTFFPKVIEEGLVSNNHVGLEKVASFMQRHRMLLTRAELEEVTSAFHRHQPNQWTANYGRIHHWNGRCTVCGHQMKKLEIDSNDFQSVQKAFLEQVIIGKNVFFKSSPKEVNSFIKFVENNGPFDVVIDSLNVMYRNTRNPDITQLKKTVEYFTSQDKRILLVGNNLLSTFKDHARKLKPRPALYITSTTRTDDAFFLYAALHSGKETLVVSCDKLRDHKHLLEPSLRPIFHLWILSAQVCNWFISKSGEFVVGKRHLYELGPAKDDGGWHIPEYDMDAANPFGNFGVLCLRNKTKLADSNDMDTNSKSYMQTRNKQQSVTRPGHGKTHIEPNTAAAKPNGTHKTRVKEWFES